MTLLPKVKLKTLVSFPANVRGGTGINVEQVNGVYTFNIDYSEIAPVPIIPPDNVDTTYIVAWDSINNTFTTISLPDASASVPSTGSDVAWVAYTPTLAFATPGSPIPTFSNVLTRYTVISNVVHVTFDITMPTVGTSANGMLLMTLPVACGSSVVSGGGKETIAGKALALTQGSLITQLGISLADGTSCITAGANSRFIGTVAYEKQTVVGTAPAAFVNAAAQSSVTATSLTPALPTSRVNGNLLIGWCRVFGPQVGTLSVSSGWTICVPINQGGNRPAIIFYRYVDGTETAPVLTMTAGSTSFYAQVVQYTGAISSSPFGNFTTTWADGTTASDLGSLTDPRCAAVTVSHSASTVINFSLYNSGSPVAPPGFTSRSLTSGALVSDKTTVNIGDTAGPYTNAPATAANWTTCLLEVRSQ